MTLSKANVQAVTKGEWASVWAGYDSPFVLFNSKCPTLPTSF
jgi:hypothetical protein